MTEEVVKLITDEVERSGIHSCRVWNNALHHIEFTDVHPSFALVAISKLRSHTLMMGFSDAQHLEGLQRKFGNRLRVLALANGIKCGLLNLRDDLWSVALFK